MKHKAIATCLLGIALSLGSYHRKPLGDASGVTSRAQREGQDQTCVFWSPPLSAPTFEGTENAWFVTSRANLVYTHDAGKTWSVTSGMPLGGFSMISFADSQHGWNLSAIETNVDSYTSSAADSAVAVVSRTEDGGATWSPTAVLTKAETEMAGWPVHMIFADDAEGWIVGGQGGVWRSHDGGLTWQVQASKVEGRVSGFQVISRYEAVVYDQMGNIYQTADGGTTWRHSGSGRDGPNLPNRDSDVDQSFFFLDGRKALLGSSSGEIRRTYDGGMTWHGVRGAIAFAQVFELSFCDEKNGWALGSPDAGRIGATDFRDLILVTSDGGLTWRPAGHPAVNGPEGTGLDDHIHLADQANGWLTTASHSEGGEYKCEVYRTDDGGNTWQMVLSASRDSTGGALLVPASGAVIEDRFISNGRGTEIGRLD